MPRRATRQQRQQRSAGAEEVESAKPHMQPTKGGRARRAPWPLGLSSGRWLPLCVFSASNPDLGGAKRAQFLQVQEAADRREPPSATRATAARSTASRAPGDQRRPETPRVQQDPATPTTGNASGRSRSPPTKLFPTQPTLLMYRHGQVAMECLRHGGKGAAGRALAGLGKQRRAAHLHRRAVRAAAVYRAGCAKRQRGGAHSASPGHPAAAAAAQRRG